MTDKIYVIKHGVNAGSIKHKVMQSLGQKNYDFLKKYADERDISIQELIRGIIIPEWLKVNRE